LWLDFYMATILVTGGAGFIGSHVVEALVGRGDQVRVLDNFSTGNLTNLEAVRSTVELIEGDIRDPETVSHAVQGVDGIVHLAALSGVQRSIAEPRMTHNINVTGSLNVLLAAQVAGIRRIVCASSASVYGDPATIPTPEGSPLAPLSPYGATKVAMEQYGAVFSAVYGLSVISLRYFNVYGARQSLQSDYAAVIPAFAAKIQAGEAVTIYGNGTQSRDFVHVRDVATVTIAALDAPLAVSGAFNVGTGHGVTLLELAEVLGATVPSTFLPAKAGDIRHSCAEVTKVREGLGWKPIRTLVALEGKRNRADLESNSGL
jgi:nucleoside-diphosphate-sugar epimerase